MWGRTGLGEEMPKAQVEVALARLFYVWRCLYNFPSCTAFSPPPPFSVIGEGGGVCMYFFF